MKLSDYKQYPVFQCIYKITETDSNKVYIGSTFNLKNRITRHVNSLKKNTHHSNKLQNAFNKYGIENFEVEIIKKFNNISSSQLHATEIEYIKLFNSVENGFNCILNSKTYKTFKQSKKAINNFIKNRSISIVGINLTTKERIDFNSISDAAKFVNDQATNISSCCKKKLRFVKNYVFIYLKDFDENIDYTILKKIDYNQNENAKLLRGKNNPLRVPVYKYDLSGNFIEEYHSRSYCEKKNNIPKDKLRYLILKKTPFDGFLYQYNKN